MASEDDDKPRKKITHEIGQDLSLLSVEELTERIDYKGSVLIGLNAAEAEKAVDRLVAKGIESIGISLLWSLANDAHERMAERIEQTLMAISSWGDGESPDRERASIALEDAARATMVAAGRG